MVYLNAPEAPAALCEKGRSTMKITPSNRGCWSCGTIWIAVVPNRADTWGACRADPGS